MSPTFFFVPFCIFNCTSPPLILYRFPRVKLSFSMIVLSFAWERRERRESGAGLEKGWGVGSGGEVPLVDCLSVSKLIT